MKIDRDGWQQEPTTLNLFRVYISRVLFVVVCVKPTEVWVLIKFSRCGAIDMFEDKKLWARVRGQNVMLSWVDMQSKSKIIRN